MVNPEKEVRVYYDGACPRCVRDRERYTRLAGSHARQVEWLDITGREADLRAAGIDPELALRELHVMDADGCIYREMDAYALLMARTVWLKPLAWLIVLPGIKPLLGGLYRYWVNRRLQRSGRI